MKDIALAICVVGLSAVSVFLEMKGKDATGYEMAVFICFLALII